ncbi:hypothetical protein BDR26DRAFT_894149 [Obelidium mucronatum]|nr:hypothetical protein BDR26DRAFT_894149 [Obelidium mucronatum]
MTLIDIFILENTISLLDPRISKKHCSITFSEDGNPILKVDSQNRIKVNTVAVVEQTQLRDGDVIQLAPNTAKQPNLIYLFRSNFALPPSPINKRKRSPSDSPPTAVAETTLLKRSKSENSSIPTPSGGISRTSSSCSSAYFQFDLTPNSETFWMRKNTVQGGNVISIGRSPDSSIVLNHVLVSTRHCRVFKSGGEAVLEDLRYLSVFLLCYWFCFCLCISQTSIQFEWNSG